MKPAAPLKGASTHVSGTHRGTGGRPRLGLAILLLPRKINHARNLISDHIDDRQVALKGILLAGGTGSRLFPLTKAVNKHLLPVYDKPLVMYPLTTLMLSGAREVAVVVTSDDRQAFHSLFGDGSKFGVEIRFVIQNEAKGIADALIKCETFLSGEPAVLVLGDNIFHGPLLGESLAGRTSEQIATVFSYEVSDPRAYACIELNNDGAPVSITEKPTMPRSSLAVPGLYFLPVDACETAKRLRPSDRGELEITDLNREYLTQGRLEVVPLPRGTAWIDAGTPDSLLEAGNYIRLLQHRQGLPIACPEEIALRNGWLSASSIWGDIKASPATHYSELLRSVLARHTGSTGAGISE